MMTSTEQKILDTIKSAHRYDQTKENCLYRVGGAVRDEIIGVPFKDIDYLVTNVAFDDLKKALISIADSIVSTDVGESMQVIKAVIDNSEEPYDFAIPRTEIYGKSGEHRDVATFGDPSLAIEDDLGRRDLTINAIAKDVKTGEYIDPFHGMKDIKNRVIRSVRNPDERFAEDPLRIVRAIQFANRFDFEIEQNTFASMQKNINLMKKITGERIFEEFRKAFTKSKSNSNWTIINLLNRTGLGNLLFGSDFNPIFANAINVSKNSDKFCVNLGILFLNGGDYSVLKLPNVYSKTIELARKLINQDALTVMFKNERFIAYLLDIGLSINSEVILDKLSSLAHVPLENSQLKIDSSWLMGQGYFGKELGVLQKKLVSLIYIGKLVNTEDLLQSYVLSLG